MPPKSKIKKTKSKILDPAWCKWAAAQPLEKLQQMENAIYHILTSDHKEELLLDPSQRSTDCNTLCAQHAYIYKLYRKFPQY